MTITLHTPLDYTADTVGTADMSVARVSDTLIIGLFYNTTDSELQAILVSVSGTTLTLEDTATVAAGAQNSSFAVAALSSTKAIAIYHNESGAQDDVVGVVINISGTSISSVGSEQNIKTSAGSGGPVAQIDVIALTSTTAITIFRDENFTDGPKGTAFGLDISGDTITPGSDLEIEANAIANPSIDLIPGSTTQAIATYIDSGGSGLPTGVILTKSGSSLTKGTLKDLEGSAIASGVFVGIAPLTSSVAAIGYQNSGNTLQGQVLGISGTTITTNTSSEIDASTLSISLAGTGLDSTVGMMLYKNSSNLVYAVEALVSGTSISGSTPKAIGGAAGIMADICKLSSPYAVIMYGDDIVIAESSEAGPEASDSGIYAIGAAIDTEVDGSDFWVTVWKDDGNMYAQKWDVSAMTMTLEIPLGAATLTEVQNRSTVAYPYMGSGDNVWIFGRMSNPAYLTSGTVWIIRSSTGGASGTWSVAPSGPYAGGFEDADVLDSLHVTPDLSGLGDRFFSGVRRRGGNAPEFWRGLNGMTFVSAIPLPTGTGVNWRGMHVNRQYEVSLGSNMLGTGSSRVLSAASPWTSWRDITGMAGPTPFPSGTVGVLRYF